MLRTLSLLTLLLAAPAFAQTEVAGDWGGYLDASSAVPGQDSLLIVFHLVPDGDGYTATFDSPDQGAFALPTDSVAFDGEVLTIGYAQAGLVYTGTVEDGRIAGTWTQGAHSFPLVLTPYEAPYEAPVEAAANRPKANPKARGDFSGVWRGALALPQGGEIRMTFTLTREGDGYTAVLDAPGQADNLPLGAIAVNGKDVAIDIMGQASFTGTVSADETTMEGTFAQGGQKLPMTLTRQ